MKSIKTIFVLIILFMISFLGIKKYRSFSISNDLKKQESHRLNSAAKVLNKCFDLENKNKRTINESMKLIEYCLKEYGLKN